MKDNFIKNYFNFENKIVLVTGCNGQLGMSIVNLFIRS